MSETQHMKFDDLSQAEQSRLTVDLQNAVAEYPEVEGLDLAIDGLRDVEGVGLVACAHVETNKGTLRAVAPF